MILDHRQEKIYNDIFSLHAKCLNEAIASDGLHREDTEAWIGDDDFKPETPIIHSITQLPGIEREHWIIETAWDDGGSSVLFALISLEADRIIFLASHVDTRVQTLYTEPY